MADALLVRFDSGDQGSYGKLFARGEKFYTGELPPAAHPGDVQPPGVYQVVWAKSPRLKRYTYRLVGVPGRSGILIHPANLMGDPAKGFKSQLLGCIALGEKLGVMDGQKALLLSAPAVRRFESLMGREPFTLEIKQC